MARNQETPVTFEFPDGDSAKLITWEYVLKQLEDLLTEPLNKMMASNGHLKNIADKLEEFIDDDDKEE